MAELFGVEEEEQPRVGPCFLCARPERLEGHKICEACHDPERCRRCSPSDDVTFANVQAGKKSMT